MIPEKREQTILDCASQVHLLASRVYRSIPKRTVSYDDLVSVAWIGAIKAVDRFDPDKSSLTTYVERKVRGALLDHLRSVDPLKRGQRKRVKNEVESDVVYVELSPRLGYSPDFFNQIVVSLAVKKLILKAQLTDREYAIVKLRSWGHGVEALGKMFGIEQSRVSQLNSKALRQIREASL